MPPMIALQTPARMAQLSGVRGVPSLMALRTLGPRTLATSAALRNAHPERPPGMTVREARAIKQAGENQPESAKVDAARVEDDLQQARRQQAGLPRRKHNRLSVWLARKIAPLLGITLPVYRASYATNKMYNACANAHEHQAWFWYGVCGLPRTFQTWWTITALHVWIVHARLRTLPMEDVSRAYVQALTNHFFLDSEERMQTEYHIKRERLVRKFMKDIHQQHRGVVFALDEALAQPPIAQVGAYGVAQPDYKFSAALWRIIWGAGGFARGFDAVGGVRAKISDTEDAPEAEKEALQQAEREAEVKAEEERLEAIRQGKPDPFLPVMPVAANTTLYSGRVVPGQFSVPSEAASKAISDAVDYPELAFPQQLEVVTEYVHRELRRLMVRTNQEVYAGALFPKGDPMNPKEVLPQAREPSSAFPRQVYVCPPEDGGEAKTQGSAGSLNSADEGVVEGSIFGQPWLL